MSSETVLHLRKLYGVNQKVYGNSFFLPLKSTTSIQEQGEQTVVTHVCGNSLVLSNLSNGNDFFINAGANSKGITCVKVFKNKKFFGIACKGEEYPFILICDVQEYKIRKVLKANDVGSQEIICIDRSHDNKLFIAQGGSPEYRLSIWFFHDSLKVKKNVGALQVLGNDESDSKTYKSSVNYSGKFICVSGEKLFRIYKVEDGKISLVRKDLAVSNTENQSFLSHLWLEGQQQDRLIVSNASGSLFLIEDNELKCTLNCSPSNQLSINVIIPFEKAFLTGGEDGYVTFFESTDDHNLFKKQKTIKLGNENNMFNSDDITITNMDFDFNTGNLVISTKAGQVSIMQITGSLQLKDAEPEKLVPFHFKRITGVSIAIKKPYISTCGLDRTVRILNYHTNEFEIVKKFPMEAHSISIHPTGFFLVVGFTDKLRYFKILGRDIREEISYPIRNCFEVKFSNGGQYFAAAHGTAIHIYDTYTYEHLYSLRNAHTGKVSSLCWHENDTFISSVDLNGNVVEFELKNETKVWDHLFPDTSLTDVQVIGKTTYVVGNDALVHVFVDQSHVNEYKTDPKYSYSSLCLTKRNKVLYTGKEDGTLVAYQHSNLSDIKSKHFNQSGVISKLISSHAGKILISISDDGSMAMYEIRDKDSVGDGLILLPSEKKEKEKEKSKKRGTSSKKQNSIEEWDEEILISKADLQAKIDMIRDLELKCQDLKSDNEYNQIKKQLEFNSIRKQQSDNFYKEIAKRSEREKKLKNEIKEKKRKHEMERKEKIEIHKKRLTDLDYQYNERINDTLNKLKELEAEKKLEYTKLVSLGDRVKFENESNKNHLISTNKSVLKEKEIQIEKIKKEITKMKKKHSKELEKLKKKNNDYIEKIEDEFERKLKKSQMENEKLVLENNEKTSHEQEFDQNINKLKEEIEKKKGELRDKKEEYGTKDRETSSIQKENQEREDTIAEKEKRIHELNKQNKELKKFRFVLNYKIETLQNEINPNNERIESMKKELKKYKRESDKYVKDQKDMNNKIRDLERKIHGNSLELKKLNSNQKDLDSYKSRVRTDTQEVIRYFDDIKELKRRTVAFYQKHASKTSEKLKITIVDLNKENNRKRIYLEKTVDSLKNKLVKAKNTAHKETSRIMHENVMLLNEINQLRKELRFLQRRIHEKKKKTMYRKTYSETDLLNRHGPSIDMNQSKRILEMQRMEIAALRNRYSALLKEKRSSSSRSSIRLFGSKRKKSE